MNSTVTSRQIKTYGPKVYTKDGVTYSLTATVRYDDECRNGHNSFAITGSQTRLRGRTWVDDCCGCLHDLIAEHFPELAPFIKWHGMTSVGPLHYVANTIYHASDRDCWGLLKGEPKQIVNGRTKEPGWELVAIDEQGNVMPTYRLPKALTAPECPTSTFRLEWRPWCRIGEGKARELDAARSSAIWPEATDEELTAPGLADRLLARLPKLIEDFQADLKKLGLQY